MAGLTLTRVPVDAEADVALLEAAGVIDPNTADALSETFQALLAEDKRRVVIDCRQVRYMNCTGLGTLVKYAEKLLTLGGGVALLGVSQKNRTVLEMLGHHHSFVTVCEHRPRAFAALADPAGLAKAREDWAKVAQPRRPSTTVEPSTSDLAPRAPCCRSDPSQQEPD